jgi:hypothetical protein
MNPPLPLLEPEWIAKLSDRTTAADLPNDMTVLRRIVHDLMTLAWQDRQQLRQMQQVMTRLEQLLAPEPPSMANAGGRKNKKRRRH